ncbi:SusD/RagB family nutrient-binding outer membrane lipoprotein [Pedobacter jejuensis]|uniref:SusD/RagB family nutrient-binding outer membrane lipoprotein n=1 Tax=Pedobacter jejuensis TaxID=1268550 RepID=A0A3N0BQ03_9SPHI|nr:SusD/RagB family nutrient-binding outer membrane lipoprotein [Pedobacter jejuensis]RNL50545.1 SusD/RagB family nutrient-binding outer membrane lipoprotein [Pedobacter jejuensis]
MKKIFILFFALAGISISSCKKYLDVNTNPNQAISGTPELVLPQAMVAVANQTWAYNLYGAQTVGYLANGGGVSGWGAIISYNYASTDQQGLWNNTYDIATDIQYVIDNTEGKAGYAQFNAAAKVMKAYAFQRLVDQYGDVPYTDALKGGSSVTPKYDKAVDIYKSLADLCDAAIVAFKANPSAATNFKAADVIFGTSSATLEITRWIKFANTLKLRLILRAGNKVTFSNTTFDAAGFLDDDAQVNPGYAKVSGKQNPFWNSFVYTFANAAVAGSTQYVPTPFVMGFYNGTKLTDPARANVTYKNGITTATNQLGNQLATAGRGATPNSWFRGTNATTFESQGIFKGPDAPQPLFLAADSYFLQAEGILKGIIVTGSAQTNYNLGIQSAFRFMYKTNTGAIATGKDPVADATAYQAANSTNYRANYNLAVGATQQLESIITQKYIALNMLFGDEAWNEFRRTGYPVSNPDISAATPAQTIVSIAGESTASDKLPTRLLYPSTEFTYNPANVPKDVNKYSTKIFWAR